MLIRIIENQVKGYMKNKVNIQDIIKALGDENLLVSTDVGSLEDREITGITFNSKEVCAGSLFVVKGAAFKEQYLDDAISSGASCYVREANGVDIDQNKKDGCPGIFVSDVRMAMAVIAPAFYGRLSDELKVIGITGTKGKSTTAYFMRYILDEHYLSLGIGRSAICSGIANYDGVNEGEAHLTTPEIFELYSHMDNALKSDIGHMTMEVSSQALKYDRVEGVTFEVAAFLNIGNDHISDIEHADFDDYLESKLRIFKQCRKACYCLDTDELERVKAAASQCSEVISFSQNDESANVYAYDVSSDRGKVTMRVRGRGIKGFEDFDEEFRPGTFGKINVENALAAISISALLGIPLSSIKAGLAATRVPGRMEVFRSTDGKKIAIVDFAHNELSFERFFESAEDEFPGKKIIAVFGATGSKGVTRRTGMGTAAGKHCAYSILSEDDPGNEDPFEICRQIGECIAAEGGKYEIIIDREEAVKKAVSLADEDTILFIAGRGTETGEKRGNKYVEIGSDIDFIKKYL